MPAQICLLCTAQIEIAPRLTCIKWLWLERGLRRMINLRSDKMAMPVAAAVDMPVAAARSFLFSTHGSVVGNLLNSIVFKIGLVSFLPFVRSFARSYVRRYISLYARAAYGVVYRLRLAPHATAAAPPPPLQRRRHHRACRVCLCVCIKKKPLSFQQS